MQGRLVSSLSELQKETLCIMKKVRNFSIPLITCTSVRFEQYQRLANGESKLTCVTDCNNSIIPTVSETKPRYSSLQPNVENDSWKIQTPLLSRFQDWIFSPDCVPNNGKRMTMYYIGFAAMTAVLVYAALLSRLTPCTYVPSHRLIWSMKKISLDKIQTNFRELLELCL